jgi:hypothetical protein
MAKTKQTAARGSGHPAEGSRKSFAPECNLKRLLKDHVSQGSSNQGNSNQAIQGVSGVPPGGAHAEIRQTLYFWKQLSYVELYCGLSAFIMLVVPLSSFTATVSI